MYRMILFLLTLTLWSSTSSANDLTLVLDHSAYLNRNYPALFLTPDVSQPNRLPRVARQLDQLEDFLQGDIALKNGSLDTLDCSQCVCHGCAQK